jgi:hypothetical protein
MKLKIGDQVKWVSRAGNLQGTITDIFLSPSAAQLMTPWMIIQVPGYASGCCLCATDGYLKQMKVEKLELVTE